MSTNPIDPLSAPINAVDSLIQSFDNKGIVIGGVAATFLGTPRMTADVDALIMMGHADIPRLITRANALGLVERLPDTEDFALRSNMILLRHEESGVDVDIAIGQLPFEEEAVQRAKVYQTEHVRLRLPSPEDLIILKLAAFRPKDRIDIESIIELHPDLDRDRIVEWGRKFSQLLERPEMMEYLLRKLELS